MREAPSIASSSPGFRCLRCGSCCRWEGFVIVDDEDIARLARAVGLTEWVFVQRYTRLSPNRNQLVLKDGPDGACIFLANDRCRVYDARPEQCRAFPHAWRVEGPCPGRHAGP